MADAVFWIVAGYLVLGVVFAPAFVLRGVNRLDPVAAGSPMVFRVLIVPGTVALWPLLAWRWAVAGKAGSS